MRHDKLEKELNLLLLLTENHNYEVGQICEKIGISRRMLYYYLESFRDWGFKVEKNGRYYSIDRQSPFFMHLFERINFTEDEALTLLAILNKVDDRNAITERIRHKLDRFYDLNILSHPEIREKTAHNVSVLYKAIKSKQLVKIIGYSSPHSKSVKDRIVEPFLLLNNNNEIRAYEYSSNMNKTFKVSRMDNVELLDLSWEHEAKHKQIYTDIFMFSGEDKQHIKLRLGLLSHNLMLEEYPESRNHITQEDSQHWILDLEVVSFLGIGRFVLGLFGDIEILENEEFKNYVAQKIGAMLNKANT